MRKVYSHENLTIVYSAKGLLELNDIECFIKNEYHASGGHVGFAMIPIELWVKDTDQADRAIALLKKELDPARHKPDWHCQHCGEDNDDSFETCWKCQNPRPDTD